MYSLSPSLRYINYLFVPTYSTLEGESVFKSPWKWRISSPVTPSPARECPLARSQRPSVGTFGTGTKGAGCRKRCWKEPSPPIPAYWAELKLWIWKAIPTPPFILRIYIHMCESVGLLACVRGTGEGRGAFLLLITFKFFQVNVCPSVSGDFPLKSTVWTVWTFAFLYLF